MKQILVVDDNVASLKQVGSQLTGSYEFSLVTSGAEALSLCDREPPDLILLDVDMPEMNGFETLDRLKGSPGLKDVPVIFLTGNIDEDTEIRALQSGARDFITKPVNKKVLQHRIELHLQLYRYQNNLENSLKELESSIVASFADLIECRDENTGGHVLRTSKYLEILGRELLDRGLFADELSEETLELMVQAVPFHDIGKIGISDVLLLKPCALTDDEYAEVRRHTLIGAHVLANIYKRTPSRHYLALAMLMAEGHHERFDGTGYPYGKKGGDIPLCCRIMSVVNVFDACLTERHYRTALSNAEACDVIERGDGTEFDPVIVDAFRAVKDTLTEPYTRHLHPPVKSAKLSHLNKNIMVIDDNIASLKQIGTYLAGNHEYSLATSGGQAISSCVRQAPDLVLLDVEMPDMDGFKTITNLKENPALNHIPVIFLTGNRDVETEVKGLVSGAVDFIKKPVGRGILLHRIELHLNMASYRSYLVDSVKEMADNLSESVAELIECRDENTGGHVTRTSKYVEMLGQEMISKGLFADELSEASLKMIVRAAPLHDVGKISISDRILLKPGQLDDEEFAIMKKHAEIGGEILKSMLERTPTQTYLQYACLIAVSHHERFDGRGYPGGFAGDDIPLCGRIMAVADVYDALTEDRVYRKRMSHAEASRIIIDGCGQQFDPRVIEAFESCNLKFSKMASCFEGVIGNKAGNIGLDEAH